MTDNKPTVLVTVTRPEGLQNFFNNLGAAGYDLKHFNIADQDELINEATEMSKSGSPIALIASRVMRSAGFFKPGVYTGARNGEELASDLESRLETPSLKIIYSLMVTNDNLLALDGDAMHRTVAVAKTGYCPEDAKRDSSVTIAALNKFYGELKAG